MTHTYSISGMTCRGCAAAVKKSLTSLAHVKKVEVDLAEGKAEVTMSHHVPLEQLQQSLGGQAYRISERNHSGNGHADHGAPAKTAIRQGRDHFWKDTGVWTSASFNTLNCLIGCSIGDFA